MTISENPDSKVNSLEEKEKSKKQLVLMEDETSGELISSPSEAKVRFSGNDLNAENIDPYMSLPVNNADWGKGELLKREVDEMLMVWSGDKETLPSAVRAYRIEGLGKADSLLFFKIQIESDRYDFDFIFRRADGTVKKYNLNFPRREEIFESGGDVEFYLKEIAAKEERYVSGERKKPWRVSGQEK